MLYFLFFALNYLSEFLAQIGTVILIGAVLALPLNYVVKAIETDGEVDLKERSRVNAKKRMKKEKIDVEIEG